MKRQHFTISFPITSTDLLTLSQQLQTQHVLDFITQYLIVTTQSDAESSITSQNDAEVYIKPVERSETTHQTSNNFSNDL